MNFKARYFLAVIPIFLIGVILYMFSDIVAYIVIAWVMSMVGAPLMTFFKRFVGKNTAAFLTLFSFVIFFFIIIRIFFPPLINQARNLAKIDYSAIIKNLEEPMADVNNWLIDKGLKEDSESIEKEESEPIEDIQIVSTHLVELDSLLNNSEDSLTQRNVAIIVEVNQPTTHQHQSEVKKENISLIERIRSQILSVLNPSTIPSLFGSFLGTIGNILIAILSIFFIAFFFLKEHGLFGKMVSSGIPDKHVGHTLTAIDEISNLLIRYFVGIMAQVTVITAFVWIALSIVGIKNALLIAFFAALMNVIPYLGPLFGAAFAVVITISSQVDVSFYSDILPDIFKVLGVFAVMQVMDNFILQPTIFGRSVKAHPLEIFIVVLIGAKLGGIGGMVLAIPTYTVLRVIGKVFFSEFKIVQSITKSLQ